MLKKENQVCDSRKNGVVTHARVKSWAGTGTEASKVHWLVLCVNLTQARVIRKEPQLRKCLCKI